MAVSGNNALLQVKNLTIATQTESGYSKAPESLSFSIHNNESVGLVGGSASGTHLLPLAITGLLPSSPAVEREGEIFFAGENIYGMEQKRLKEIRGREIGVIFRDSASHLNPVQKIGVQVGEALRIHSPHTDSKDVYSRSLLMMKQAGIPDPGQVYDAYPHMLSGNIRQRALIAIAMMMNPRLLIADEPACVPDGTIRARIMETIKQLKEAHRFSLFFISRNISLAAEICSRIIVMYAGSAVEIALKKSLLDMPLHPYTIQLFSSLPFLSRGENPLRISPGNSNHPESSGKGCRFLHCCAKHFKKCEKEIQPPLFRAGEDHFVSCWLYGK